MTLRNTVTGSCLALWPASQPSPESVVVPDRSGNRLLALHLGAPGVTVERCPTADHGRHFLRVDAVDVSLPSDRARRLAAGELDAITATGRLLNAAAMLGTMQEALDRTVEHVTTRTQFGSPIGANQAVAHRCADMLALVEQTRSLVYAAAAGDAAEPELSLLAHILCFSHAVEVLTSALHLHGAAGLVASSELPRGLRRCEVSRQLWGTPADNMRTAVAAMVTADPSKEDNHG